jgi:hypothetical protein
LSGKSFARSAAFLPSLRRHILGIVSVGKPFTLTLIDGGYAVIGYMLMGLVLVLF